MKFISDNLLILALAVVLGLSPLQTISASVYKCMNMKQSMHHQMKGSKMVMSSDMDMTKKSNQHKCCEQSSCDMTHCANTIAAVITSGFLNDMTYTISNIHLKPSIPLTHFYPSSLYRPPKV